MEPIIKDIMYSRILMYSAFINAVSTVATLTAGNQFDCKIQDFPVNLRESSDGMQEAIFEFEYRSLNWTLELRVKNWEITLVRVIFDALSNNLTMKCSGNEETQLHFLWNSTYKIKVGKTLSELSQLIASGEFESIMKVICRTPDHLHNVRLERFERQANNVLNVSVCSPAADVSIILVISVGISISVILLVSAVSYYLLKKKTAEQTPNDLHYHNGDDLVPTQPRQVLLVPTFQNSLSLDRGQLRAHDDSSHATTLLSFRPELMRFEPLMLHGYSRGLVQEPISHSTLTLPEVFEHPDNNFISSRVCNEYHNSEPPLTFNSLTPEGQKDQYLGNSHLVVSSPCTSRSLLHAPQLVMPKSHLSGALEEVPSHYSTTGRSRPPATTSFQDMSYVPKTELRRKDIYDMEDDTYERITFVFSDN